MIAPLGTPALEATTGATRVLGIVSLGVAALLVVANAIHAARPGLLEHWWTPLVVVIVALGADLMSGLVHWGADTASQPAGATAGSRPPSSFRCASGSWNA
jgi:hypothetical protein